MKRLLALLALGVATVALGACSAPANQPCAWHGGIRREHLNRSGSTLVLICRDSTVIVRHQ